MKKIAVVTGTRAEYGYLKPLMKAVEKESSLQLIPIITGMHLLHEFGNTYKIVEKDFPNSTKIPMKLKGDSLADMGYYFGSGIQNFTKYFEKNRPNIVIVLGDRSESLAAGLSAMYQNIAIAHINGGDVSGGTIDESIRHAITKIAHIHFAHTKENAKRIERMGEQKERIFVTGALTIDIIKNKQLDSKQNVFKRYGLNPAKPTFLVVQHPITTLKDKGLSQIKELMKVLEELKQQTVMLYPNCDAGSKSFIELINKYEEKDYLHIFKNIVHEDYLSILKNAEIMIGNSSSGIIEAPSFKIPVINIGSRQDGRTRSKNIIDVKPSKEKILQAIDFVKNDNEFKNKIKTCKNEFGDGYTAEKIVTILKEIDINDNIIQKKITY
jgi:UDP-N-acetylglucosamine 2-epimerase (non-hydrolysing)/GDP/UDP-N,N'-diacetylbacillosamine 2-epimerase (hydrolysing)